MNMKIVAIAILAVVALVLVLGVGRLAKPAATTTAPSEAAPEESAILSVQENALLNEQMSAVSNDASDFSSAAQDSMASDSSQFLYQ